MSNSALRRTTLLLPLILACGGAPQPVDEVEDVDLTEGQSEPAGRRVLASGETVEGSLDGADEQLPDGRPVETFVLEQPAGRPQTLAVTGAEAVLLDPAGRQLSLNPGGSLVVSQEGVYRVQVIGAAGAVTAYSLSVDSPERGGGTAWPALGRAHHLFPQGEAPATEVQVGSETRGQLGAESVRLPSGETADLYRVAVQPGHELSVDLGSGDFDPYLMVVDPAGQHWENDDANGGRDSALTVPVNGRGSLWVVVTSYERGEQGSYTLKIAETARAGVVASPAAQASSRSTGELAAGDERLESGAFVDRYAVVLEAGQRAEIQLTSSAFDTLLAVTGPDGSQQTNDDIDYDGGNTNSMLALTVAQSGVHQVLVTSYRAGSTGQYTLEARGAELRPNGANGANGATTNTNGATPTAPANADARTITGELAAGDAQLESGEFVDEVSLDLPAHSTVSLQLTSAQFDTYLAVMSPSGERRHNDDVSPNDTSSALQIRTEAAGTYRVFVTSYRAGETGAYQLVAQYNGAGNGGGTANNGGTANGGTNPNASARPGDRRGSLQQGDTQLQSGELFDTHTVTLTPGQPAHISATSSAFDTYLIVQTPSGRQLDNDDAAPNDTNARVDIPSAEAGEYRVLVTSYRPGETGAYVLSYGAGRVTAAPAGGNDRGMESGVATNTNGRGRLWGIFAGISDYPGSANDLPECANDAIKLAETLRSTGLMAPAQQVVLTDAGATRDAVRNAFQQVARQMGPQDTFVFFYSGHGGQRMNSGDRLELDGIDETLVLYDGEVVDDEVAQWFEPIQGLAIVALDSCFSGGFAKDVISRPGRMGLFSSQEDVLSAVAAQFQAGGYLSHFLRMAFQGDADVGPHDGVLTAGELAHFVLNQFGAHVRDVQMQDAWQHAVIERGGVRAGMPLLAYR
ncbi:MAG: hypothetical protein CMN30_04180 [Sandaracinus sp.]|nr:hypothetical protein [Sandaracinus sp.]